MLSMTISVKHKTVRNNKRTNYTKHYQFSESESGKFYKTLEAYRMRLQNDYIVSPYTEIVSISKWTKVISSIWQVRGYEGSNEMRRNTEIEVIIWQDET